MRFTLFPPDAGDVPSFEPSVVGPAVEVAVGSVVEMAMEGSNSLRRRSWPALCMADVIVDEGNVFVKSIAYPGDLWLFTSQLERAAKELNQILEPELVLLSCDEVMQRLPAPGFELLCAALQKRRMRFEEKDLRDILDIPRGSTVLLGPLFHSRNSDAKEALSRLEKDAVLRIYPGLRFEESCRTWSEERARNPELPNGTLVTLLCIANYL